MIAEVKMWGRTIGAVSLEEGENVASFQYDPVFAGSGIELSPLFMPLSSRIYRFPALPHETFHGLPGLLADSLPDKFGNALINAWLATQGRNPESFNAVERLCYVGKRGMGSLEFAPVLGPRPRKATKVAIDSLVNLAEEVLLNRNDLRGHFHEEGKPEVLRDILRVGTSAGGARAKAVIAWNPETNEVRSGQVPPDEGFDHWLLKFDGVAGNKDKELDDPKGFGAIEYAYFLMARTAGIQMNACRLLEESGRRHFMTRRFDRLAGGEKLHMQSLGGMMHFDFNQAGAYSYEQALQTIRRLGLPVGVLEEQFRRAVFNIIARNQDDHVKNIAFLMDKHGEWSLSPAFDVTYSYNPTGDWTGTHQMTLNGKRDKFTLEDFNACGKAALIKQGRARVIVDEVIDVVKQWPDFANHVGIPEILVRKIQNSHRLRSEF